MDSKMPALKPHQQRVVEEQRDLAERLRSLDAFLGTPAFAGLDAFEQDRLRRQAVLMGGYNSVLLERIAAFGDGS
jgi:hypothetical protein